MHMHRLALPPTTTTLKLIDITSKITSSLQAPNKRRCCKLEDSLLDFLGLKPCSPGSASIMIKRIYNSEQIRPDIVLILS